jgi:hypothetical protein
VTVLHPRVVKAPRHYSTLLVPTPVPLGWRQDVPRWRGCQCVLLDVSAHVRVLDQVGAAGANVFPSVGGIFALQPDVPLESTAAAIEDVRRSNRR